LKASSAAVQLLVLVQRRAAATDPALPRGRLLARAGELLDAIGLLALDRELLIAAGTLAEPSLRALDAIHIAAAISAGALDAFVTYDERQDAAARLTGLRTIARTIAPAS
jgi:hypothetical protein